MGGTETIAGVSIRWAVRTDVGLNRKVNEDSAVARPPVFMVADGMGGHDFGDVASRLAVDRFSSLSPNDPATGEMIVGLIRLANEDVFRAGVESSVAGSMGTTAVGIALVSQVDEPMWVIFNVGDSRVYRLEGTNLQQLSTDHSYVQELVAAGSLTAAAARTHPQRNVVTRALGVDEAVEADVWLRPPEAGERFLICSDGLSGEVDDPEIASTLLAESDPDEAARRLVEAALEAGGRDNVTVMVVDVIDIDSADVYTTAPKEAAGVPVGAELQSTGKGGDEPAEVESGVQEVDAEDGDLGTLISGMPKSLMTSPDPGLSAGPPGPKFDEPVRVLSDDEPELPSSPESLSDDEQTGAADTETRVEEICREDTGEDDE